MKRVMLCLKQKVKVGHENDYGVMNGYKTIYTFKGGYKKLCKQAAECSKLIGENFGMGLYFFDSDVLVGGLAAVCVETLKDHGSGVVCDYFENGEHVNTIVEDAKFHLEEIRKQKKFGSMRKILEQLYVLQRKLMAYSFTIDYRNDDKGEVFICVTIFVKSDSTPQSFAFYPFRSLEGNIREYQCLVDLLEGRVEEREELEIF